MVNLLRQKMREEILNDFDGSEEVKIQKLLVQQAVREVVDDREWSFQIYDDGLAYFPGLYEDADTVTATQFSTSVTFDDATVDDRNKWASPRRSRIVFPEDTKFPQQSYGIAEIQSTSSQLLTLVNPYYGDSFVATADATLYCHEMALPDGVESVVSVVDENGPLELVHVNKHLSFDSMVQRPLDATSDRPEIVYVGSTVQGTAYNQTSGSNTVFPLYNTGMMIWPVPSSDVLLRYSYQKRSTTLTDATDELVGVPLNIQDLIASVAFEKALMDNTEDDSRRAIRLRAENDERIKQLQALDAPDRHRRKAPMPFGGFAGPHPNARWDSRVVPSP